MGFTIAPAAFPNVNGGGMNFWADVAFTPSPSSNKAAAPKSLASHSTAAGASGYTALTSGQSTRPFTILATAATPTRGTPPIVVGLTPFRRPIPQSATRPSFKGAHRFDER